MRLFLCAIQSYKTGWGFHNIWSGIYNFFPRLNIICCKKFEKIWGIYIKGKSLLNNMLQVEVDW